MMILLLPPSSPPKLILVLLLLTLSTSINVTAINTTIINGTTTIDHGNNSSILNSVGGEDDDDGVLSFLRNFTGGGSSNTTGLPSETRACASYFDTVNTFLLEHPPGPINCANQTYPRWGPPEHQELSCCSDEARFASQSLRLGGFEIIYKNQRELTSNDEIDIDTIRTNRSPLKPEDAECHAYTDALRATLCDPRQGGYIVTVAGDKENTTTGTDDVSMMFMLICQSSCDAVFDACGEPGVNYPPDLSYTDGTSMCYEAWGGGWYSDDPCDKNGHQFPCKHNLRLHVVDDVTDKNAFCLPIVVPTQKDIDSYEQNGQPQDACSPDGKDGQQIIAISVGVSIAAVCVCFILIIWYARHQEEEEEFS